MPDQSSAATEHAILQEITAPLERLPDDPLSVIDAQFPHALRGYDRLAVDEYVQHTRQLVAELQATRSPEAAVRRALERVGEQISGVLQRAHETAEQITAQSRAEAEDRLEQARIEADHIAGAAEQRVRELDADTDRIWMERQRIVADAEDLASQLQALARVAAERFPTDDEDDPGVGDEDEAALVAGLPVEAGAAQNEVDRGPEVEREPEDEWEPQDDDVERTVAFSPLAPDEGAGPAVAPEPEEPTEPTERVQGPAEPTERVEEPTEPTEPTERGDEPTEPTERGDEPTEPTERGDEPTEPTERGEEPTEPTERVEESPPAPGAGAPPLAEFTDDDSTRVIRPASQAANRRLDR